MLSLPFFFFFLMMYLILQCLSLVGLFLVLFFFPNLQHCTFDSSSKIQAQSLFTFSLF